MTATAQQRGHLIHYADGWRYSDDTPANAERPCVRCRRLPTLKGHDACSADTPGCTSLCCGHGVEEPYQMRVLGGDGLRRAVQSESTGGL